MVLCWQTLSVLEVDLTIDIVIVHMIVIELTKIFPSTAKVIWKDILSYFVCYIASDETWYSYFFWSTILDIPRS